MNFENFTGKDPAFLLRIAVISDEIGGVVHDLQEKHPLSEIMIALAWVVAHNCKHQDDSEAALKRFKEAASEMMGSL